MNDARCTKQHPASDPSSNGRCTKGARAWEECQIRVGVGAGFFLLC